MELADSVLLALATATVTLWPLGLFGRNPFEGWRKVWPLWALCAGVVAGIAWWHTRLSTDSYLIGLATILLTQVTLRLAAARRARRIVWKFMVARDRMAGAARGVRSTLTGLEIMPLWGRQRWWAPDRKSLLPAWVLGLVNGLVISAGLAFDHKVETAVAVGPSVMFMLATAVSDGFHDKIDDRISESSAARAQADIR